MQKKMARRTLFSVLAILVLVLAFQWWTKNVRDPNFGSFDSAGYIAAIRSKGDASQVVLIDPSGEVIESPDYVAGSADENPVWTPDGQRIYFMSDREKRQNHIFRWNPSPRFEGVQRLTIDSRSKQGLTFDVPGAETKNLDGLYLSGGTVMYFDPNAEKPTRQVLPPTTLNATSTEGEGAGGQFDQLYSKFGSSFKIAKWGPNKSWIACVMRQSEGGEMLIIQDMKAENAPPEPIPLMGDRIDIDVSKTGRLVATFLHCRFFEPMAPPEAKQGGVMKAPFRHGTILIDVSLGGNSRMVPIVTHQSDKIAFTLPKISPDGESVAFLAGPNNGVGHIAVSAVYVAKLEDGGGKESVAAIKSPLVRDAQWTTDGSKLLLTMLEGDGQAIYSVNKDGSDLKNLTKGLGSFRSPRMSPVLKK